jgi:NADPH-ferrihemoprotein reductase
MGESTQYTNMLPVFYDPPADWSPGPQVYDPIVQQLLATCTAYSDSLPITRMKELKKDPSASTILVELACGEIAYASADNLCLFPENTEDDVCELARLQSYELDRTFAFSGTKAPFPTPCTLREALMRYCDLTSLVKKRFLKELAAYATSASDREALLTLSSLKGKAEFVTRIQEAYLHLKDLFKLFPSVKVPAGELVQLLSRIQPRYFTIASSPLQSSSALQIVLSVQKTLTFDGYMKTGLCSGYLQRMFHTAVYKPVNVFFKASHFRLPQNPVPLLFVCNGAGIAPFRALLQDLQVSNSHQPVLLFYGCPTRDSHFLFRKELNEAITPGSGEALPHEYLAERAAVKPVLTHLFCTFSRDQPAKVYIQNALSANAELVWELIYSQQACVFVCG